MSVEGDEHYVLTQEEWVSEREKVARSLWARKWHTTWDQYSVGREVATPESDDLRAEEMQNAETVLVALGYKKRFMIVTTVLSEFDWKAQRERVARAIFLAEYPNSVKSTSSDASPEENALFFYKSASAAMRALGFKKEGSDV